MGYSIGIGAVRRLSAALVFLSVLPCHADPTSDAKAIIDATVTPTALAAVLAGQGRLISDAMQTRYRKLGIKVSDPDAFTRLFSKEFQPDFLKRFKTALVPIYVAHFTPEQLAALRAFYEGPAGKALVREMPGILKESSQAGRQAGVMAGMAVAPRVLKEMKREGIAFSAVKAGGDE